MKNKKSANTSFMLRNLVIRMITTQEKFFDLKEVNAKSAEM